MVLEKVVKLVVSKNLSRDVIRDIELFSASYWLPKGGVCGQSAVWVVNDEFFDLAWQSEDTTSHTDEN